MRRGADEINAAEARRRSILARRARSNTDQAAGHQCPARSQDHGKRARFADGVRHGLHERQVRDLGGKSGEVIRHAVLLS